MSLFNLNPFKKAITIADNIDQLIDDPTRAVTQLIDGGLDGFLGELTGQGFGGDIAVSYTHLTLPTILLV